MTPREGSVVSQVQALLLLDHRLQEARLGRPPVPAETRPLRQLLGQLSRAADRQAVTVAVLDAFERHWTGSPEDVGRLTQYLSGLQLLRSEWTALTVSPVQAAQIPDSEFYCYDRSRREDTSVMVMVSGRPEPRRGFVPCPFWSVENTPGRAFADGHCSLLEISDHDLDDRKDGAEHSPGRLLWDQVRSCPPVLPEVVVPAEPFASVEVFVQRFIEAETRFWQTHDSASAAEPFGLSRFMFLVLFYGFMAELVMPRASSPTDAAAVFPGSRRLLRLQFLNLDGRLIHVAETGWDASAGSLRTERLLIEGRLGAERIVAVHGLNDEGAWIHLQGEPFALPLPELLAETHPDPPPEPVRLAPLELGPASSSAELFQSTLGGQPVVFTPFTAGGRTIVFNPLTEQQPSEVVEFIQLILGDDHLLTPVEEALILGSVSMVQRGPEEHRRLRGFIDRLSRDSGQIDRLVFEFRTEHQLFREGSLVRSLLGVLFPDGTPQDLNVEVESVRFHREETLEPALVSPWLLLQEGEDESAVQALLDALSWNVDLAPQARVILGHFR